MNSQKSFANLSYIYSALRVLEEVYSPPGTYNAPYQLLKKVFCLQRNCCISVQCFPKTCLQLHLELDLPYFGDLKAGRFYNSRSKISYGGDDVL